MDRVERDFIALACIVMGKWADAGLIDGDDTSRQGDEDPEWRKAKIAVATVQQFDGADCICGEINARHCPVHNDGSPCPHDPSCDHRDGCNFEGPGALWCPRHKTRHDARIDGQADA